MKNVSQLPALGREVNGIRIECSAGNEVYWKSDFKKEGMFGSFESSAHRRAVKRGEN